MNREYTNIRINFAEKGMAAHQRIIKASQGLAIFDDLHSWNRTRVPSMVSNKITIIESTFETPDVLPGGLKGITELG